MTQQLDSDRSAADSSSSGFDRFFRITSRGSTVARELRGGLTTFVAMSYIVLLNPLILGSATDSTGARLDPAQLTTATALCAGITTVLMGVAGNAPLAMAAGLGVIPVVAFTIAPAMTWPQAFGLVVLAGAVIVLLAALVLRIFYDAGRCDSRFSYVTCIGVGSMFMVQTIINIGMCVGVLPVIGLTLPFFSYGGSSIVTLFGSLGIVAGFVLRQRPAWLRGSGDE